MSEAQAWWGAADGNTEDLQPVWMSQPADVESGGSTNVTASAAVPSPSTDNRQQVEVNESRSCGTCCCITLISLGRIVNILVSLFIIALVLGSWIPAARIPFPTQNGFWKYPESSGINDICIAVQAFLFAFIMICFELSMLLQRRAMSFALFTFRWFGFMMVPHFALLFTALYALLACTLSYIGIIAGCLLFAISFCLRLAGKRAAKRKAEPGAEMTQKDEAVNDRTVVRETIKGQIDRNWGSSYFNSKEAKASFKPWLRPTLLFLTVGLNAATLFLLLIIEFPEKILIGIFDPSTVYLLWEGVVLCLVVLINELVSCTLVPWPTKTHASSKCVCSQAFVKAYLGFLVNDRARISTFLLQGFVVICISGLIPFVFGGLLAANALLNVAVLCGFWGHKSNDAVQSPRADASV